MNIMTFFNHAGGVGKSSTARDVAYLLGELGHRVLLIDADPQANLTEWMGVTEDVPLESTVYPALIDDGGLENMSDLSLPIPMSRYGIDLIPSTLELAAAEQRLVGEVDGIRRLNEAIRKLEGYDFVLIDPSPSLGMLSSCCTVAADYVVVPLPPNSKGRKGLPTILTTIKRFRRVNPSLRLLMAVITNRENTRQDREMLTLYQEKLGSVMPLSSPLTHRPAVFRNAEHAGQPIPVFEPGGEADKEIRTVADELLVALASSKDRVA
ncbi:MAG: ParA family protein [Deinococcota bacterium]|nr:ParA family protein [Deinococcota bacterium]